MPDSDATSSNADSDSSATGGEWRQSVTGRRPFLKSLAAGATVGSTLLAGCETDDPNQTETASRTGTPTDSQSDDIGVGIYLGNEAALAEWEKWFGRTVDYYSFDVPTTGWNKYRIDNMPFERPIEPIASERNIAVTAKMFPPAASTMAAVANGTHTDKFRQFAESLVSHGMSDATVRLGHEMNGRWSPDTAVGRPEQFISAWKQIVGAMNDVSGAQFRYMWAPHIGQVHMDPVRAYPGDDWVDVVGLTMYDQSERYYPSDCQDSCVSRLRQENWDRLVSNEFGLDFWAEFAKKRGKPLAFPEYGVVNRNWNDVGGGDNAKFFEWFGQWARQNRDVVSWHNVWCFVAGPHYVGPPSLHNSDQYSPLRDASESYRALFGPE